MRYPPREYVLNDKPVANAQQMQQLLLGVVSTRLCAKYSTVIDARVAWLLESQSLLSRLDQPAVEAALLEPTMALIAATEIQSIARESHLLLEIVHTFMC